MRRPRGDDVVDLNPVRLASLAIGSMPDPGELARCEARFPGHHITREANWDRVRVVALSRSLDIHPYALVAASLDEVCTELARAYQ
jgi:hypothetical protein